MNENRTAPVKSAAVLRLMAYANENPDATDTAEGIARWWIKRPIEEVLPALKSLVRLGIWERVIRDDRVLYRPMLRVSRNEIRADCEEAALRPNFESCRQAAKALYPAGSKFKITDK